MDRRTFPGFSQMSVSEVKVFAKMLKKDGYIAAEIMDFLEGIDKCLTLQASASIINRFAGKRKHNNKKARDIIHDAAMQIPIPERFINQEE